MQKLDPAWYRYVNAVVIDNFDHEYNLKFSRDPDNENEGAKVEKVHNLEDGGVKVKFLEGDKKGQEEVFN